MNLFLGYYIPSNHSVPLWEMDNDYYLHNLHVKTGRESVKSMKRYQQTFAAEWSDEEEDEPRTLSASARKKSNGSKFTSWRADRFNSNEESSKILRVRRRCEHQNEVLSLWWKVAIQSYIQQRMWMQLGRSPTESSLPTRFERLYQPDKLSQFDKIFARTYTVPVRLSHSAQHSPSEDDIDIQPKLTFSPRNDNEKKHQEASDMLVESEVLNIFDVKSEESSGTLLASYVDCQKFGPSMYPSLSHYLGQMEALNFNANKHRLSNTYHRQGDKGTSGKQGRQNSNLVTYVGNLPEMGRPCDEYLHYTENKTVNPFSADYRRAVRDEFNKCLQETNLNSGDVEGIFKVNNFACIGIRHCRI